MGDLRVEVGRRLRQARVDAGFNQEGLAQRLSLSQEGYSSMERGRTLIGLDVLLAVCRVLDRPVVYFVGDNSGDVADLSPTTQELVGIMEGLAREDRLALITYARFLAQEAAKECGE